MMLKYWCTNHRQLIQPNYYAITPQLTSILGTTFGTKWLLHSIVLKIDSKTLWVVQWCLWNSTIHYLQHKVPPLGAPSLSGCAAPFHQAGLQEGHEPFHCRSPYSCKCMPMSLHVHKCTTRELWEKQSITRPQNLVVTITWLCATAKYM